LTTIFCPRDDCQYCNDEICQRDAIDLCCPPGKLPYCLCIEMKKAPVSPAADQERTKNDYSNISDQLILSRRKKTSN
jgi:hypothetical protein